MRKVKALEKRLGHLTRQAAKLRQDQQSLNLRNAVLGGWVDSLTLLNVSTAVTTNSVLSPEQQELLLQQELALLHNANLLCSASGSMTLGVSLPDPGPPTLSPAGDPMSYFRCAVAKGAAPEAAHMTPFDVASLLREAVLTSRVLDPQQQQDTAYAVDAPVRHEAWDRYFHVVASLLVLGRTDVLEAADAFDLDTLTAHPNNIAAAEQRMEAHVPLLLQLTAQQQDLLSLAADTSEPLITQLHQQQLGLQQQLAAAADTAAWDTASLAADICMISGATNRDPGSRMTISRHSAGSVCSSDSCPASSVSSGGSSSSSSLLNAISTRQEQLEQQLHQCARLGLLLSKAHMVVHLVASFVLGSMSYQQVANMYTMCWPYHARPFYIAKVVRKLRAQELEQQQKEQLRQRRSQRFQSS